MSSIVVLAAAALALIAYAATLATGAGPLGFFSGMASCRRRSESETTRQLQSVTVASVIAATVGGAGSVILFATLGPGAFAGYAFLLFCLGLLIAGGVGQLVEARLHAEARDRETQDDL